MDRSFFSFPLDELGFALIVIHLDERWELWKLRLDRRSLALQQD